MEIETRISSSVVYDYDEEDQKHIFKAETDRYYAGRFVDHGGHVVSGHSDPVVFL